MYSDTIRHAMTHFLTRSGIFIGATVRWTDLSMSEQDKLRRRYFSMPENIWSFLTKYLSDVVLATGILVILTELLVEMRVDVGWGWLGVAL